MTFFLILIIKLLGQRFFFLWCWLWFNRLFFFYFFRKFFKCLRILFNLLFQQLFKKRFLFSRHFRFLFFLFFDLWLFCWLNVFVLGTFCSRLHSCIRIVHSLSHVNFRKRTRIWVIAFLFTWVFA